MRQLEIFLLKNSLNYICMIIYQIHIHICTENGMEAAEVAIIVKQMLSADLSAYSDTAQLNRQLTRNVPWMRW